MRKRISEFNQALNILDSYFEKEDKLQIMACCCGHGKYDKTLVLKQRGFKGSSNYVEPCYFEHFSGVVIPRTRNFYKRDKQGYYYIPEVHKPNEVKKTIFTK